MVKEKKTTLTFDRHSSADEGSRPPRSESAESFGPHDLLSHVSSN